MVAKYSTPLNHTPVGTVVRFMSDWGDFVHKGDEGTVVMAVPPEARVVQAVKAVQFPDGEIVFPPKTYILQVVQEAPSLVETRAKIHGVIKEKASTAYQNLQRG